MGARLLANDIPKNGMQGGLAAWRASRYSLKFFVPAMSVLIVTKVAFIRAGTWSQVRFKRAMGAVPSAEMIDVRVEKLFSPRHFF